MIGLGGVPIRSRWFRAWVSIAAAGLLVATALWAAQPPGSAPGASPGGAGTGSPAPTGSAPAASSPAAEAWARLTLAPYTPIAYLTATRGDPAGVAVDTAFRLRSAGSTPAATIASRLEVAPPVALKVTAGASDAEAVVTPVSPLTAGTSYRFRVRTDAGTVAASWLFQAKQPLHVVTTIPGDAATDVPVGTGIEAVFDQDGVVGYAERVRIEPAIPFRVELHARTVAIVPQRDLEPRTLYTVTIGSGVGVAGSDVRLEQDVVFRFETGGPKTTGVHLSFEGGLTESSPADVVVLAVDVCCPEVFPDLSQQVDVYRLASLDAAVAAARAVTRSPTWASWSDVGLVPTSGLATALRFKASLSPERPGSGVYVLRLPSKLPAGWYLIVLPQAGRDAQLVLQVTRLATEQMVSTTRTVAWVNDVAGGGPVAGATVSLAGGATLGRTDADGLLVVTTPAALLDTDIAADAPAPALVVRAPDGEASFSILGDGAGWQPALGMDGMGDPWSASSRYWLAFGTDRQLYRTTDTIQAWGTVRARDGRAVGSTEVRLLPDAAGVDEAAPPIARVTTIPDAIGTFTASLPISDAAMGSYRVVLVADGRIVRDSWIYIDEVRKPAYAIDVTVDRHVLIAGETFRATARAAFLDGTPVPGLELVFTDQGRGRTAKTDADGRASLTLTATLDKEVGWSVGVKPVRPEEGIVEGGAQLRIYPSAVWLTSDATLEATSLSVTGRAQALDVAGLEQAWDSPVNTEPGGAPVAGRAVPITVTRIVQHQRETGRAYDWISKQTVPIYETWTTEEAVASVSRTTDADGRFATTVTVPDAAGQYRVETGAKDAAGRTASSSAYAGASYETWRPGPWLRAGAGGATECCADYAVGERVSLSVADPVAAAAPGGARYLFITAQRGIRDAVVATTAALELPFTADDVPNVMVSAVEFTGRNLVPIGGYSATIRQETRQLEVVLSTDAAAYRPGADVRLTVQTFAPDGRATPASVVVQAVDEKFYLMGAANVVDPLAELYASVADGVLWSQATFTLRGLSGGDTTGGGGMGDTMRAEFVDTLLFRRVSTDASGRASIEFRLSDDLTSWRISAGAVDAALDAGSATKLVPASLPFFVDATIAPEFLASDRPVLRVRAYGDALKAGDTVRFTVAAPTLGLKATTVDGTAFQAARVTLPALAVGTHRIEVTASTVGRTPALTDGVARTIRVVGSRYEEATTAYQVLDATFTPGGGSALTTYVIADIGRGRLASILERLAWSDGARVDQVLGAAVARDLLVEAFGRDGAQLPPSRFEATAYMKEGGVGLLPYGDGDLALTAQVALAAPDRFDPSWLRGQVEASYGDPGSTMTRERGIIALAALAALGDPVAGRLGPFAAAADLTARERLYLGLAYAYLGDDASAAALERSVLEQYGYASGPWLRLEVSPDRDEVIEATGLLAVLSATLGDPLADRAQAYVEANPPRTTLLTLEELAFVRNSLDRMPTAPARFAYTVDGARKVVDLAAGDAFTLTLASAQRATLRLERLAGDLGVTTSWVEAARPGDRPADPDVKVVRTVAPGTSVAETQIVRIRLDVTFAGTASDGCYEVVDRVPSGLAPIEGEPAPGVIGPYAIAGQLVHFCVARTMDSHTAGYSARVVSPGTYTWEPATVASTSDPGRVSATGMATLTIK